jgi:hypothetical protein
MTGRFRAERSNYIKSKQEEVAFFKRRSDGLFSRVADVIRREGREWIRNVPFKSVWDAFWQVPNPYIFIKYSHKLAVIYAYDGEAKRYIGGLLDITGKKDMDRFYATHSVVNRDGFSFVDGEFVEIIKKLTNIHGYPIFPPAAPNNLIQHEYSLPGWDYEIDL